MTVAKNQRMGQAKIHRRWIAGVSALFLIASLLLFIGHHHVDENDTSTCLICRGVSPSAPETGNLALPGVHIVTTVLLLPDPDLRIATECADANSVRAPPSS